MDPLFIDYTLEGNSALVRTHAFFLYGHAEAYDKVWH
jgi:hypothetical protein